MLKDFRKLYPNWKFLVTYKFDYQVEKTLELGLENEEPSVSESNRLVIPFNNNYDGPPEKWYETSELCDKMGEHIKEYICQKFELKGDWELNTYSMRTERIGRLANHLPLFILSRMSSMLSDSLKYKKFFKYFIINYFFSY